VALVLTEPAMTNTIHLLLPEPGWHDQLRGLTRRYGTLLGIDETHTHVAGTGGATAMWHLDPDIVTIGKAVAGGLPMGAYGVTAGLGEQLDAARSVATGGTLFGNPLSAAAAKAALTQVLVPGAYAHALTDDLLTRLIRIWLANRGVWEARPGAGPTVPIPATRADVARYLRAYSELLARLR
jgi:glutamate-1-semialdehyde 2,1-aminomutase